MDNYNNSHTKAMDLVEEAFILRRKGQIPESNSLFLRAFELEKEAALHFKDVLEYEPTRSVFLRSAASLAIECRNFIEAERLIAYALSGNPPAEIADELRNLLSTLHLRLI